MKRQSWQMKRFLRPRQYIDAQGYHVSEYVNNSGVRVTVKSKEPVKNPELYQQNWLSEAALVAASVRLKPSSSRLPALFLPFLGNMLFSSQRSQGQEKKNFACFSQNCFALERSGSLTHCALSLGEITRISYLVFPAILTRLLGMPSGERALDLGRSNHARHR